MGKEHAIPVWPNTWYTSSCCLFLSVPKKPAERCDPDIEDKEWERGVEHATPVGLTLGPTLGTR